MRKLLLGLAAGLTISATAGAEEIWQTLPEPPARLSSAPEELDDFVARISDVWATEPNYSKDQLRAIPVRTVIFAGEHDEAIEPAHTAEMATLPSLRS